MGRSLVTLLPNPNSVLGIRTRKCAPQSHSAATEPLRPNGFVAPSIADGTISLELFTEACSSIGSSRLSLVRVQSHAIATESATTCNTNTKNDCP